MLQHCVVENSLAQEGIFNIMNAMDILHKYHTNMNSNLISWKKSPPHSPKKT